MSLATAAVFPKFVTVGRPGKARAMGAACALNCCGERPKPPLRQHQQRQQPQPPPHVSPAANAAWENGMPQPERTDKSQEEAGEAPASPAEEEAEQEEQQEEEDQGQKMRQIGMTIRDTGVPPTDEKSQVEAANANPSPSTSTAASTDVDCHISQEGQERQRQQQDGMEEEEGEWNLRYHNTFLHFRFEPDVDDRICQSEPCSPCRRDWEDMAAPAEKEARQEVERAEQDEQKKEDEQEDEQEDGDASDEELEPPLEISNTFLQYRFRRRRYPRSKSAPPAFLAQKLGSSSFDDTQKTPRRLPELMPSKSKILEHGAEARRPSNGSVQALPCLLQRP